MQSRLIRADFREGDEHSNFSVFRVRWFSEWPEPLHWIAFPVEILTKPPFTELPPPFSLKNPFFTEKCFVTSPSQKSAPTWSFQLSPSEFPTHTKKGVWWVALSKFSISLENFGDGPNTVSESTVSNTELSEFFALTEFRGENSVSSSHAICMEFRLWANGVVRKWGRTDLAGFYLDSRVGVRLVPLKTHDLKGLRPDLNRF